MTAPLRECPFCGKADRLKIYDFGLTGPSFGVNCSNCPEPKTEEEAAAVWNTRHAPSDWVAVSTEPEHAGWYLATLATGDDDDGKPRYPVVDVWFGCNGWENPNVIAWQPLPDPYTPPSPDREGEE